MNDTVNEHDKKPVYFLLENAIGSIEAGPDQQERLEEMTIDVAQGNFHVHTDGVIPCGCIDGRDTRDGLSPKPDSAGGTESLFVADDLTTKRFGGKDGSTAAGFQNTLAHVSELGLPIGGHNDNHASGEASGCGANDKLPAIYEFIAKNGTMLRDVAASLGIRASDAAFEMIIDNASTRSEFSSGAEMLGKLRAYGEDKVDPLVGQHNEVVAVINTIQGTTLDRKALAAKYGDAYESFNIDAWTFDKAAEVMSLQEDGVTFDEDEKEAKVLALALYNLATAHVLCGPNMRVIVLAPEDTE